MKCSTCGRDVSLDCDWNQGRCPNRPSIVEKFYKCPVFIRCHNLIQIVKGFFKNGKN